MTTGDTETKNPIDKAQENLDKQQAGETTPSYVTSVEMEAIKKQNEQLQAQVRGLQAGFDKGLTSIRKEQERRIDDKFKRHLEDVPEELQSGLKAAFDESTQLREELVRRDSVAPVTPVDSKTAERIEYVRSIGVDPNDSRIDYSILDHAGSQADNTTAFLDRVYQVKYQPSQTAGSAPQAAPQSDMVDPPNDAAPIGMSGNEDEDGLRDMFITRKIDLEEYNERRKKLGVSDLRNTY